MIKRLRVNRCWCPACGCDVSEFVKAEVKAHIVRMSVAGGNARAEALTPERRTEIASKAARKRWKQEKPDVGNG